MATDTAPAPNPGRNRDLGSLEQRLLEFARKAKDQASKTNVTETVARDTYKNWLSENLEVVLGEYDLAYLLNQKGFLAVFARLLHSLAGMNEQARLLLFNAWAAYVDQSNIGGPLVADTLAAFFYAMPRALPLMFNDPSPKLEHINAELEKLAKTTGFSEMDSMKLWKARGETEVIHKDGPEWHPVPADGKEPINTGSPYSMWERFPEGPWCPICFRRELRAGLIRIEKIEKVTGVKKARGFRAVADFRDPIKQKFFDAIEMLAAIEVREDHGLGFEGEANHILAAHTLGLGNDPVGLEDIIPQDEAAADRMIELAEMTPTEIAQEKRLTGRVLLPLSARRYVRKLLAAYRVDHPTSHAVVQAKDWGDSIISWVPASLKPKQKGWAGVNEVASSPLGAIFLLLLAILAALILIPLAVVLLILAIVALIFVINTAIGISSILELFRPYLSSLVMSIERSAATVWISTVLLGMLTWFDVRGAYTWVRTRVSSNTTTTVTHTEFVRPKLLTVRVGAAAVGLIGTIVGWGLGHISNFGVAAIICAIWFTILAVEATIKWEHRLPEKFKLDGLMYALKSFGWGIVITAALAVLFFAVFGPADADRARALSAGVANRGVDRVAVATGVEVPPTAERCVKGLAQLERDAKGLSMTVDRICELTNNDFPCNCR